MPSRSRGLPRRVGRIAGEGAILVGVGLFRIAKHIWDNTEWGEWEPADMRPGETPQEHLRRKHNEDMGGNYGRHEDLRGTAYVRDRTGRLRPYEP
jgi:hypothetical protein